MTVLFSAACPNMSLNALNVSTCLDNGEGRIACETSTVGFSCSYDVDASTATVYAWFLDDVPLPQSEFDSHVAYITLESGDHSVKCQAVIADCSCEDSLSLHVTVVGMLHLIANSHRRRVVLWAAVKTDCKEHLKTIVRLRCRKCSCVGFYNITNVI